MKKTELALSENSAENEVTDLLYDFTKIDINLHMYAQLCIRSITQQLQERTKFLLPHTGGNQETVYSTYYFSSSDIKLAFSCLCSQGKPMKSIGHKKKKKGNKKAKLLWE